MYLIYNCGHYLTLVITVKSGKKYAFKKRYVTKVDDKDVDYFLNKTSKDVSWCPKHDRSIPPSMKLEYFCKCSKVRFDNKPFKIYDHKKYNELFL